MNDQADLAARVGRFSGAARSPSIFLCPQGDARLHNSGSADDHQRLTMKPGIALLLSLATAISTSAFAYDLSGEWSRADPAGPPSIHITQTGEIFHATETRSGSQTSYSSSYTGTLQASHRERKISEQRWKVCFDRLIDFVHICWWGYVNGDGTRIDLHPIAVGPFRQRPQVWFKH